MSGSVSAPPALNYYCTLDILHFCTCNISCKNHRGFHHRNMKFCMYRIQIQVHHCCINHLSHLQHMQLKHFLILKHFFPISVYCAWKTGSMWPSSEVGNVVISSDQAKSYLQVQKIKSNELPSCDVARGTL